MSWTFPLLPALKLHTIICYINASPTRLLEALNSMQGVLLSTLRQIGGTSTQLASAAEELNAVTEEGSRETHRQHLEIEQAATAVSKPPELVMRGGALLSSPMKSVHSRTAHPNRREKSRR